MSKHKVECKCCGMMMVPRTIFSRGISGGWGWRIGGGKPISSCCPFCLSENWDDPEATTEMSVWHKTLLMVVLLIIIFGAYRVIEGIASRFDAWASIEMYVQWCFVGVGILFYRVFKRTK